ncbi:MAG: hypothetical protein ACM3X5_05700 [Bacillota bacterium]
MNRTAISEADARVIEHLIAPWRAQIEQATSEQELFAIVNRFLGRWPLPQLFVLPEGCRPCHVANIEELSHWAFHLARSLEGFNGSEEELLLLEDMALFFDLAYAHLSELSRAVFEARARPH